MRAIQSTRGKPTETQTIMVKESNKTMDAWNPFGVISTAIIFDKQMEKEIQKRVERLRTKIERLKEHKQILSEQNKELLQKVFELETENLYATTNGNRDEEVWMNDIRHSVMFKSNNFVENEIGEQSVAVQKLMKGYAEAMQKLDPMLLELDDTNKHSHSHSNAHGFKQKYKSFRVWINTNLPFSNDIRWAFLNYGHGISSFFEFYRYVVLNTCIIFLSYSYFLIKQLIDFKNNALGYKYSDFFEFGLPKFSMFSMCDESLANVFASATIMMMAIMTYSSCNKWISENKKQITAQLLTTQSDTTKFASLSFVAWDFSKYTSKEVHEQKHALAEEFRLLLQDEKLLNLKQSRSKKEKYVLLARRTSGIVLNIAFVVASWYAIFMIISTQQYVIEQLSKLIGETPAKAMHPTVSIIFVGLILPSITFSITTFERWETKIETMKHQIWRLYFGRIANLIVAGIPAYIIYKDLDATETIAATFSDPVDALVGKNDADGTYSIFQDNRYLCFEDVAAYYLIKLVISDFVVGKIIKVITYYIKQLLNTFTKLKLAHSPYNVAESIIEILYTQGLIFMTMPFYPFLAIVAPFVLYLNFKFEQYVLSKFKGKTDASWKAEETGSFFIIFYNCTLVVGLIANYYFLSSEWPCYKRVSDSSLTIDTTLSTKQGPFASIDPSQPWYAAQKWMQDHKLSDVLQIFENALLFIFISITISLRAALKDNKNQAQIQLLQLKDKEIEELYKKLWAQKRRLELQKDENLRSVTK